MDKRLNKISLLWGAPGLVIQMGGYAVSRTAEDPHVATVGTLVALGGLGLLTVGLVYYAKAKGLHPAVGLLGLASIIGIIVLRCLPDKLKGPPPLPGTGGSNAPVGDEQPPPLPR